MDDLMSTLQVARLLRVGEWRIYRLLRTGGIRAPEKTPGGDFLWSRSQVRDLARALDLPCPPEVAEDQEVAPKKRTLVVQEGRP